MIAHYMRQTILLHIWKSRCLGIFSNHVMHLEFEMLQFYSNIMVQLTFLQFQLKRNDTYYKSLAEIKYQLLNLYQGKAKCFKQLQKFWNFKCNCCSKFCCKDLVSSLLIRKLSLKIFVSNLCYASSLFDLTCSFCSI